MRKEDLTQDYGKYFFFENNTFQPRGDDLKAYLEGKFKQMSDEHDDVKFMMKESEAIVVEAIENLELDIDPQQIETSVKKVVAEDITPKFEEVKTKIDTSKTELKEKMENVKEHLCCDITKATESIKNDISEKNNLITEKLSDLNKQVGAIVEQLKSHP